MKAMLEQLGSDLSVRIPTALAEGAHLAPGSEVELTIHNGAIVLTQASTIGPSLAEMIAAVTDDNIHAEIRTGPAVGGEAW